MVFSSIVFLFYFLPIILLFYFISPKKYRNLILLIFSLFFYGWGEPKFIILMLFSIVLDYTCGRFVHYYKEKSNIKMAKRWLFVSIVGNLGLLGFFKYANFFIDNFNNLLGANIPILNIVLPIGISFYTFQTMSYTIDVYRGDTKVQNNIISFGAYVTLFPQLIAGPIVRYQTIAEEIDNRNETIDLFSEGMKRFIVGLGKKVLLANNIGLAWEFVRKVDNPPVMTAWIGIIAFGFQIYFDFSGYSDMAIGLGKIFGFNFLENFEYPYTSKSITEFWRRWHISLGTWFKEYLYIPLGGNRRGKLFQVRNIFIVWTLTGIWHGASWNFMFWGIYFGILLIIEKFFLMNILKKIPSIFSRAYTLLIVCISWVIFSFYSVGDIWNYLKSMFGIGQVKLFDTSSLYLFYTNIILLIFLIIGSTAIPKNSWNKFVDKYGKRGMILENILLIFVLIMSVAYLVDQSYNPFIYFRF